MTTDLDDATVFEHDQHVGVAHSREAMRDDNSCPVAHQRVEGAAHLRLADGVEMRGCFVEDQGRRVLQKGARDRDPLALPARELHATFPDFGVEALRQARDKFRERRLVERLSDRRLIGIGAGERDIGAQRVIEEIGILRHERDAAAQMIEFEFRQIDPVDQDVPLHRIPEAQQQIGERRLAGAGGADDRHCRAGWNIERDSIERRPPRARIKKPDMLEPDRRSAGRRRRAERAVAHRGLFRVHRVQTPRRGDRVGQLPADLRDLRDRQKRGERQQYQQGQGGCGEFAVCDKPSARHRHPEPAKPGDDL